MKKIIALILLVIIILSVEHTKIISFFTAQTSEVLATVNGEEITFEEVEFLYDMRHTQNFTTTMNVPELQWEYAEIIYTRIEQILVAQELANRNLQVEEKEVQALEKDISLEYLLNENGGVDSNEVSDFKINLQNLGIDYTTWQRQLRASLEQKRLSKELARFIILNSEETLAYVVKNPNMGNKQPARMDFSIIQGKDKESVEAIPLDKSNDLDKLYESGFNIKRASLNIETVPKKYHKLLAPLANKTFSAVGRDKDGFFILYLHSATHNKSSSAIDIYALAEQAILEEKIPKAYDEWLFSAIDVSDIQIAKEFLPNQLPDKREKIDILSFIKSKNDINKTARVLEEQPNLPTK